MFPSPSNLLGYYVLTNLGLCPIDGYCRSPGISVQVWPFVPCELWYFDWVVVRNDYLYWRELDIDGKGDASAASLEDISIF